MTMNRRRALVSLGSLIAGVGFTSSIPRNAYAQGTRNAFSLHIGVDRPNPAAYPGGISPLKGCVNDANDYLDIAKKKKFQKSKLLKDGEATIKEVTRYIFHAASHLNSGDIFFVTYAGHGTQVDDRSGDEANDRKDEAWCLHDGLFLDDWQYFLWSKFKPGVRILVVSDSCHSGTVSRVASAARGLMADLARGDGARTLGLAPNARGSQGNTRSFADRLARDGNVGVIADNIGLAPRTITPEQAEAAFTQPERNPIYVSQQREAGSASVPASVGATGILLAGCQDHQLSWEASTGRPGGLFTQQFKKSLAENVQPTVGYSNFLDHIAQAMPEYQRPNFFPFGAEDDTFFNQTPLTI
ncbi:MAG: caspase family protein [Planctomycetales bacterium]|nr:caspase family protein [Planctomycetales bacterium]MCA9228975.1 caspase family protein [Planctomycetales bacterium]